MAQPRQNGIPYPKEGTVSFSIFEGINALSEELDRPAMFKEVCNKLNKNGEYNDKTLRTVYGKWKRFWGLYGSMTPLKSKTVVKPIPKKDDK